MEKNRFPSEVQKEGKISRRDFLKLSVTAPAVIEGFAKGLLNPNYEPAEGFLLTDVDFEDETMIGVFADIDSKTGHVVKSSNLGETENAKWSGDQSLSQQKNKFLRNVESSDLEEEIDRISTAIAGRFYYSKLGLTDGPNKGFFIRPKDANDKYVVQIYDVTGLPRLFRCVVNDQSVAASELFSYKGENQYPYRLSVFPEGFFIEYMTPERTFETRNTMYSILFYKFDGDYPYDVLAHYDTDLTRIRRIDAEPETSHFLANSVWLPIGVVQSGFVSSFGARGLDMTHPTVVSVDKQGRVSVDHILIGDVNLFSENARQLRAYGIWRNGEIFTVYLHKEHNKVKFVFEEARHRKGDNSDILDSVNRKIVDSGAYRYDVTGVGDVFASGVETKTFLLPGEDGFHLILFQKQNGNIKEYDYSFSMNDKVDLLNADSRLHLTPLEDSTGVVIEYSVEYGRRIGNLGTFSGEKFVLDYTEPKVLPPGVQA